MCDRFLFSLGWLWRLANALQYYFFSALLFLLLRARVINLERGLEESMPLGMWCRIPEKQEISDPTSPPVVWAASPKALTDLVDPIARGEKEQE